MCNGRGGNVPPVVVHGTNDAGAFDRLSCAQHFP